MLFPNGFPMCGVTIKCGEGMCAKCTHPTHFEECEHYEEAVAKEDCDYYEREPNH